MATEQNTDDKITVVNIREEVYKLIRQRILDHNYPPGFRFDLSELETQLGISRTPLKEALQRLEIEGLVEIRPRRGTFVSQIDAQELMDNYGVRHALELYIARTALADVDQSKIDNACALNDKMRALSKQNDYSSIIDEYLELDQKFHHQVIAISQNKRLLQIYEQIATHILLMRFLQSFSLSQLRQAQAEHDAIAHAFQGRDVEGLIRAIDRHNNGGLGRMEVALQQSKDLLSGP